MNVKNNNISYIIAFAITASLPILDGSIMNTLLPFFASVFAVSKEKVQLIVSTYFLASIMGLLLSIVLQKKMGAKKVWFMANILFLLGSLWAALASHFPHLIAARIVQGFGAGLLLPLTQVLVAEHYDKAEIKSIMGLVSIPAILAPACGPLLGTGLSLALSWQWVFLINLPLIVVALWCGHQFHNFAPPANGQQCASFFFFSAALLLFFTGALNFHAYPLLWLGAIIFFAIILLAISAWQNRREGRAILHLPLLWQYPVATYIYLTFAVSFLFYGFLIFYPLLSENQTGMLFTAILLGMQGVGAWFGRKFLLGKLKNHSDGRILSFSLFFSAATIGLIYYQGLWAVLGFFLRGVTLGIATIYCLSAPLTLVAPTAIKDISVFIRIAQQMGGVVGGIFISALLFLFHQRGLSTGDLYCLFGALSLVIFVLFLPLLAQKKQH